jgi:starch synthase
MRILMVASEAIPWAKTGGLADVVGALPLALAKLGHHVDVVIPRYRGISAGTAIGRVTVAVGGRVADAPIFAHEATNVRSVFVDQPHYFDRPALYAEAGRDYDDNPERFAFLARAALAWAATQPRYDVIHAHDWQAGLVPVLVGRVFHAHPNLSGVPTVFTIHNLAYQGTFAPGWLPALGLGWDLMRVDALEFWGRISFLKGGIMFSRLITTVSPTYAREIQTPELGFGFDGILRHRSADLVGILNGIDYDQWDPERDSHLPAHYTASNVEGKHGSKRSVLETYGRPVTDATLARPLVGMVSRMVDQKGFDLIAAAAGVLPGLDASFAVLGTGDSRY